MPIQVEREDQEWAASQAPRCEEARRTMRTFVPTDLNSRTKDELMEEGLLDAIQPDTLHMGLWFYHVLTRDLADSGHATLIAPHNYNAAYLGLRANIQFGAVTERFVIAERDVTGLGWGPALPIVGIDYADAGA